jgi:hypothetical protein
VRGTRPPDRWYSPLMRRFSAPLLSLALLVALTAGTPVPRVIPVDSGTCRDLCGVEATTCTPCPAASDELPCRDSRGVDCGLCVLCLCGVGILAPEVPVPSPAADRRDYTPVTQRLCPVPGEPASPPPKTSA